MRKSTALRFLTMSMMLGVFNNQFITNTNEEMCEKPKPTHDELNKRKGLNKFYYGENFVYALNKKNADKKAKKLNYI